MKRNWFFLTEKLQITPAERTAVTTLIAVLVVLWSIPASWFRPDPFDQEYYAPILAEFQEKVQLREIEKEQTLARFYPSVDTEPNAEPKGHPVPNRLIADASSGSGSVQIPPSHLSSSSPNQPGTNAAGQTLTFTAGLQNSDHTGGAGSAEPGSPRSSGLPPSSGPVNADTVKAVGSTNPEPGSGTKININTADVTELQKLPGIGPSIAARIVEYRVQNGPFRAIEEITGVRGIGEARLNNLRNSITVD